MYTAEHLDLIANTKDQFSDELLQLSGLLETVGEQADALDPIRISVQVQDSELDQLSAKLGALEGVDAAPDIGSGTGGFQFGNVQSGGRNTLTDSVGDALNDNMRDLADTFGDFSANRQGSFGGPQAAATSLLISQLSDMRPSGDGGDSGPDGIDLGRLDAAEDIVQADFGQLIDEGSLDLNAAITGQDAPISLPEQAIGESIDSQALMDAADFGSVDFSFDDRTVNSRRDLLGLDEQTIADNSNQGSFLGVLNEAIDPGQLQQNRLTNSLDQVRIGLTDFYDILAAGLPALLTFVGALPAVYGGLLALGTAAVGAAAGLAGIAGLGLLGAASAQAGGGQPGFEDIQAVLGGVDEAFFDAFSPLMQDLAPTFERGLAGFTDFLDELAEASGVLTILTDDFLAFGSFIGPVIADTIVGLGRLADATGPVFSEIASAVSDLDVVNGLASALAQSLPLLMSIGSTILNALPQLFQFALGMSEIAAVVKATAAQAVRFVTGFMSVFGVLGNGNKILGRTLGSLLAVSSAFFVLGTAVSFAKNNLIAKKIANAATIASEIILRQTTLASALSMDIFAKSAGGAAFATTVLTRALAGLLALTGIGLLLVGASFGVQALADKMDLFGANTRDATAALEEFQSQQNRMGSRTANLGDLSSDVYIDVTNNSETTVNGDMDEGVGDYNSFVAGSGPSTLG